MEDTGRAGPEIQFCTLGMFIIGSDMQASLGNPGLTANTDEIEYLDDRPSSTSIIGGAGTYAAVGARLVAGQVHSGSVSWIVDMGSDFPSELRGLIDTWQTRCVFRLDKQRLTTRAWNGYGANDHRGLVWCIPELPFADLAQTSNILRPR